MNYDGDDMRIKCIVKCYAEYFNDKYSIIFI